MVSRITFSRTKENLLSKNVYPDVIQLLDSLIGIFKRQYGNFRDKIHETLYNFVNYGMYCLNIGGSTEFC